MNERTGGGLIEAYRAAGNPWPAPKAAIAKWAVETGVYDGLDNRAHNPAARLSAQEAAILRRMLRLKREGWYETRWGTWGTRIRWLWTEPTRSEAASLSRSLRRLESRGLVQRKNQQTGSRRRATHVAFTPAGEAVAEELPEAETATG